MTPSRQERVRDICYAVLDCDGAERDALLASLCAGDDGLERDVVAMMADAVDPPGDASLLDRPAWEALGAFTAGAALLAGGQPAMNPGTRLGSYEILAPIGFGGMGQVYRARDLTLQRDVAIKVLPAEAATNTKSLERLRREAKLLAALNHRNIAAIYGVHEANGVLALVLELVVGPTLANRLAAGPIPLEEALPIARQVADAIEAAHEKGIIHRDLKPANVVVRPDGEVKVLDFGIAKTLDVASGRDDVAEDSGTGSLTVAGTALGTPSYMSPEQIRGLAVDRRTDLWAFGLLLWEMLTAKQPFAGATVMDRVTLALTAEPDWAMLPPHTPEAIRRLLSRALQKDRKLRLDSAAVARLEIDEALAPVAATRARWTAARLLPWGIAGASLVALAVLWASRGVSQPGALPQQARLSAELGADVVLRDDVPAVVLSPDGQTLVFSTRPTDVPSMLYVRRLNELEATPLGSTDNATAPFFSPDGKWIAFFADRKLKRISVAGGAATVVADAFNGRGGTWGTDDSIVFAPDNNPRSTLVRVPASGGTPVPVTTLLEGDVSHRWPQLLPGNRAVLYTSNTGDSWEDARLIVQPLPAGMPKVVQAGFFGRYVTSGHLLYMRGGTLFAAPFDIDRLQVTGPSAAVVEGVRADTSTGGAQFAVSDSGALVYLRGRGYSPDAPAVWMDRGGNTAPLRAKRTQWGNPQFSPDGTQLAFDVSDGKQIDIWIEDLATGQLSRLTFDPADDFKPVWTHDGQRIAFASTREGPPNLYWLRTDGSGPTERLTQSENPQSPGSWHPTGRFLAFEEAREGAARDILVLPVARNASAWKIGSPDVLVSGPSLQAEPVFSPDGRWLAYRSNETGLIEVFVQSFGGAGGKWQVSSGGGRDAAWSRTAPELLYFGTTQDRIMVAPFSTAGGSFRAGVARPWSIIQLGRPPRQGRTFDLHPDGSRVVAVPAENQRHMTLVFDFVERLRQISPDARPAAGR